MLLPIYFAIKDIAPQDIAPPLTLRHQDILQHFVVVMVIVMLVVVLHNLGFALVPLSEVRTLVLLQQLMIGNRMTPPKKWRIEMLTWRHLENGALQ